MKPSDVKLTSEEKFMVVVTGIVKGLYKSMLFWFIAWEVVVGWLWFPHLGVLFTVKSSDFYADMFLSSLLALGTLIVTGVALVILASLFEGIKDHFTEHIDKEAELYKKSLLDKVDERLLRK